MDSLNRKWAPDAANPWKIDKETIFLKDSLNLKWDPDAINPCFADTPESRSVQSKLAGHSRKQGSVTLVTAGGIPRQQKGNQGHSYFIPRLFLPRDGHLRR